MFICFCIYIYIHIIIHLKNDFAHEFGPPRTCLDLFRAPKLISQGKKYARCGYTNVTCPEFAKRVKDIKMLFENSNSLFCLSKLSKSGGLKNDNQQLTCVLAALRVAR